MQMFFKYFNPPEKCLKRFILKVFLLTLILSVTAQNKHTKNILMDFDYLVSQLYVQHCTFVEIGEGVCSIFVELPLEPPSCRKRALPRQLFFGNCLCSEFRTWQLCSHQLAQARPEDCLFEEGTDCPTSSARVHRRLCDVTGMSQWNPQCNCSVTLAGQIQEPLCGFRTCYASPLPASICTPRTVCGTARCDVSLHGAVYGIKCDRKCKDRQSFCERTGPSTSLRRVVTSEWSEWKLFNCNDGSSSIQQHEAECLDPENKPAFDCLGPGMFCCGSEDVDCICEVKQEEGHLKAYRYTITFTSSTEPDHASLQVRSAVGFKGQAKVWNRILNIGSKDDDSESLFSNVKERKPQKTINLQQIPRVQINLKDLMKEDVENLLSSGINIEKSNISLVQGNFEERSELNSKANSSSVPLVLKVEPDNTNSLDAMATPLMNPLNYTVSGTNNATTDQTGNMSGEIQINGQINQDESNYHYTPVVNKGMEKSVTLPPSGKEQNKKQFDNSENNEMERLEKEMVAKSEYEEKDKLSKTSENSGKENISGKENSLAIEMEKVDNNEQAKSSQTSDSESLKIDNSQVKQHTSKFFEGAKVKDSSEVQRPVQNVNGSQNQSMTKSKGSIQANVTNTNKPLPKQTNDLNGNVKSVVDSDKTKVVPGKETTHLSNQPKEQQVKEPPAKQQISQHESLKQENAKSNVKEVASNHTSGNLREKSNSDIGKLSPNNSSLVNSGVALTNTNVSKSNEIEVTSPQTTTFNTSGIIVKNRVESEKTVASTPQTTTFNSSGIIVKNKSQTTLSPVKNTDQKSNINSNQDISSNYKELEDLSKIKKEEEKKAHTTFYDEPEPVLKDLDKDSIDDNMADVLNTVIGGKNEWVKKKGETAGKKEEKSNLQSDEDTMSSDSDQVEAKKGKLQNLANFSSKTKKRKFHPG